MDDIAEAAGVTKPVLYQHFPSKRALYSELLDDVDAPAPRRPRPRRARRATTGRERVQEGFAAYFRFVTDNRAAFRLLFGASVRNDAEFAAVVDGVLADAAEAISALIEIDGTDEHRRALAHAVVGIAEATSRQRSRDPDGVDDPDVLARLGRRVGVVRAARRARRRGGRARRRRRRAGSPQSTSGGPSGGASARTRWRRTRRRAGTPPRTEPWQ